MKQIVSDSLKKIDNLNLSSLDKLRIKTVMVLMAIIASILLFAVVFRLYNEEYLVAIVDFVAALLLLSIFWFAFKGRVNIVIYSSCFVMTGLAFVLAHFQLIKPIHVVPQLTIIIILYILIIKSGRAKFLYAIIAMSLLLAISLKHDQELTQSILFIIQILGALMIFKFFADYLMTQEINLNSALEEIEDKHKIQEQINEKLVRKNDELKTFSYIMSHDLQAPIRTINSFCGLIRRKIKFTESSHEDYFRYIQNSSKQMEELIKDLLLFHKIDQQKIPLQEVDINDIIPSITSLYQYELLEKKLEFQIETLPTVGGNATLLKALFGNLISNGIKYQPKDENHIARIHIKSEELDDKTNIFVIDNGIGMKKESIKDAFTPFKRYHTASEYKGTGLGLSICKRVMDKHNGQIKILDPAENGTTFLLTFNKSPVEPDLEHV